MWRWLLKYLFQFLIKKYLVERVLKKWPKQVVFGLLAVFVVLPSIGIISAKVYQFWDDDPDRGAIAIRAGAFGESYRLPEYLDQGWDEADSLWFYNTTQGSALLPYDFLLVLEQPTDPKNPNFKVECERDGKKGAWFLCDKNIDRFRYLPQKRTFSNPDALPVGFVKETYQGKDYAGYTCAACHTGQVNFGGRALRIDGGPAMADMVGFLSELTRAMKQTQGRAARDKQRLKDFVGRVLELNNDYGDGPEIENDLAKWTNARELYNIINHSTYNKREVEYGYARLDAFGRIYNRVLQHTINREQAAEVLSLITVKRDGAVQRLLRGKEIDKVLEGIRGRDNIILRDEEFWEIIVNLQSKESGFPGLDDDQMLLVRDAIFNPPNAPVSYPFLWDITHSDYVQWNAIADNSSLGPLGRNAGEVIGVFGILDWHRDTGLSARFKKYNLAARISGQKNKKEIINFQSSIDLFNLQRLESHLTRLISPRWPFCWDKSKEKYYLPEEPKDRRVDDRDCRGDDEKIDEEMAWRGKKLYGKKCKICHDVIDRDAWDRMVVGKLVGIDSRQSTDRAMANNSVKYKGKSGNFKDTYQGVSVGDVVVREDAPVAQILTAATRGVIATPDADKWWPRRFAEWIYLVVKTLADNPIEASVKAGFYKPDTTANPYNSLRAYRARSLNGIWATAPYLHNGSVPSLYDLLLPVTPKAGRCETSRPESFQVGAREFDPKKVGFKSEGYEGFKFDTNIRGNRNQGHEYGACGMSPAQRWDLIEYLKSL
ncbi:MAG: di-heme-cytochrome C peroxidase [SAR324 cluster bacterium]|nr:di-heme-cytochrome C peroxidase [SAR324 cluster bacterium]